MNQLESAILNLCINARDAMPDGGQLRLRTRRAAAPVLRDESDVAGQDAIVVEVSDTGVGMTADVKERVFEPFFTTKPLGQGTGLGLSMIYGFVKQSRGTIDLQSTPGKGTTISLYLPKSPGADARDVPDNQAIAPRGDGQLVLVVEDDDQVRLLVSFLLEELGYVVVTASDATVAMPHISALDHVDLLITDVGLPGMNGRQLAELFRERHPAVPVLFMTGYAENAAVRSEFLGHRMSMITKPFALDAFGQAVKDALVESA